MSRSRLVARAAVLTAAIVVSSAACSGQSGRTGASLVPDADPSRGRQAVRAYGCYGCHTIDGVAGAHGRVGPPLNRIAERSYIGGVVRNTPEDLVRWIQDPVALSPGTAMPNLRVTPQDARDIAAFLYLRR